MTTDRITNMEASMRAMGASEEDIARMKKRLQAQAQEMLEDAAKKDELNETHNINILESHRNNRPTISNPHNLTEKEITQFIKDVVSWHHKENILEQLAYPGVTNYKSRASILLESFNYIILKNSYGEADVDIIDEAIADYFEKNVDERIIREFLEELKGFSSYETRQYNGINLLLENLKRNNRDIAYDRIKLHIRRNLKTHEDYFYFQ